MATYRLNTNYLKWLRNKRGLTQLETAKKAGVSAVNYWNWESGYYTPNERNLTRLARALDTTEEKLVQNTASLLTGSLEEVVFELTEEPLDILETGPESAFLLMKAGSFLGYKESNKEYRNRVRNESSDQASRDRDLESKYLGKNRKKDVKNQVKTTILYDIFEHHNIADIDRNDKNANWRLTEQGLVGIKDGQEICLDYPNEDYKYHAKEFIQKPKKKKSQEPLTVESVKQEVYESERKRQLKIRFGIIADFAEKGICNLKQFSGVYQTSVLFEQMSEEDRDKLTEKELELFRSCVGIMNQFWSEYDNYRDHPSEDFYGLSDLEKKNYSWLLDLVEPNIEQIEQIEQEEDQVETEVETEYEEEYEEEYYDE